MDYATALCSNKYAAAVLISAGAMEAGRQENSRRSKNKTAASDGTLAELIRGFTPISLEDTNKLARMLKRVDNKYVLQREELRGILAALRNEFAILNIDGVTEFRYSSCYFDDNFQSYHDHHQGRRLRYKIRARHYIDSGDIFFEVKLKDKRGQTNKERIRCQTFDAQKPSEKSLAMLKKFYRRMYNKEFLPDIEPALIVNCKRCTLVSLRGGERITIDYCLSFDPLTGSPVNIGNDFIIVETKSADGKGLADVLLKKTGIRQASKLSKYCIGAILTGRVTRYNNFRAGLKRVMENVVA
ncbi:MAG: polyphosphate polymerase domain-containing protein [Proteobacteria bacterium]|nr:polyphosphate polymerase domain-containing protein [Pseudomonadota bacterium]